MERLQIETILPDAFFGKLGRYVAICGHIEHFLWLITVKSPEYDLYNEDEVDQIFALRKSTSKLVNAFARAADLHAEPMKSEMLCIASKLDADGRDPRNMAIHGAWVGCKERAVYKVLYWRNCGAREAPDWKLQPNIAESDIDSAISYVDGIHRNLMEIAIAMDIPRRVDSEEMSPNG